MPYDFPTLPDNYLVLEGGVFDTVYGGGPEARRRYFSKAVEKDSNSIAIQFHGRDLSRQAGDADAAPLNPLYIKAGTCPLFLILGTGWAEVVKQNLPAIFGEAIERDTRTEVLDSLCPEALATSTGIPLLAVKEELASLRRRVTSLF